jgi:hypothetical protein
MFNDEEGYGSFSIFPSELQRRRNPFAMYKISKLTVYAEAVHSAKVRSFHSLVISRRSTVLLIVCISGEVVLLVPSSQHRLLQTRI